MSMHRLFRLILAAGVFFVLIFFGRLLYLRWDEYQFRNDDSRILRDLGLALQNYESAYKRFPPPSMAEHSWRIRVLPYTVSCTHYENYDFSKPWDCSENMLLDRRLLHDSKWPNEDHIGGMPAEYGTKLDFPQQTRFLMVTGDHCFGTDLGGRKSSEITDGLSNTIALAETARSDIHWLHPLDFNYDEMSFNINDGPLSIGSASGASPLVCFCDGAVYRIDQDITADALKALLTIDGAESIDRETCVTNGWLTPLK
jgi:hypothetical protein